MAINLIVNGISYSYPQDGDTDWGNDATLWASAISAATLQKTAGLYEITAELDLGSTAGIMALYFKSRTADPADAEVVRLSAGDSIAWRNDANTANNTLSVTLDNIQYNGVDLVDVSTVQTLTNKTISGATPVELGYIQGATSNIQTQLDTLFAEPDAIWGSITGTLADQTDLQNELDTKITETSTSTLTNKIMTDIGNDIHANQVHLAVRNVSGASMTTGQPVKFVGYNTGLEVVEVTLANQATDIAIGLIESPLLNNENGEVTVSGIQNNLNTIAWAEGDILWVNGAGALTNVRPATGFMQPVAFVLYSHAGNGIIQILIAHPLQDAADVRYAGALTATDVGAALDELESTSVATWGNITGTLSTQTDLQTELNKAVWLDGSKAMTGTLVIGDGASGRSLIIRESGGDQSIRLRNAAQINTTSFIEDNTADEFLILKQDPVTGATLTTVTLYGDGNMGIEGGANEPVLGSHLIRKAWFDLQTAPFVETPMVEILDPAGFDIRTVNSVIVGGSKRIVIATGEQDYPGGSQSSGDIQLIVGDCTLDNDGGNILAYAGSSDGGTSQSGGLYFGAGNGTSGGNGGHVQIKAGGVFSGAGTPGNLSILGGAGIGGSADSGYIDIRGSNSTGYRGGDIRLSPGFGSGGGTNGEVQVRGMRGVLAAGTLAFYKDTDATHTAGNKITFGVQPTLAADFNFLLPTTVGTVNQILETDGSGNLGWTANTAGVTDHTLLTNIGTTSHNNIDIALNNALSHRQDGTIHFTQAAISITSSQISDLSTNVVLRTTAQTVAGVKTFSDNMIINADLTVNGTTTTLDTDNLNVTDNIISVNNGETGAGVTLGSAGLEVDRGTADNTQWIWDETTDKWGSKLGAAAFVPFALESHTHLEADITDLQAYLLDITGESINDLSNVLTTMNPTDGQVLTFDTTNGWQSETIPSGITDHTLLTNIGTNTHAQIDTHIADGTVHFTQATISITESQVSDLQAYLLNITGESIKTLSDVFTTMVPTDGQVLTFDTTNGWQAENAQAVITSHTGLTDIGTNTHAQIDTHIADGTIHFTQAAISITESQVSDLQAYLLNITAEPINALVDVNITTVANGDLLQYNSVSGDWENVASATVGVTDHTNLTSIGSNTHAAIDTHIADGTIHFTQAAISITESQVSDLQAYLLDITGESINDLSNVLTTMNPTDGQVLTFDTTNGWQSETFVAGEAYINIDQIGILPKTPGLQAIAIGTDARAYGAGAVAIGEAPRGNGVDSVAIGTGPVAAGVRSIAIGIGAHSSDLDGIAIGNGSIGGVAQSFGIGIGSDATCYAGGTLALGKGAWAQGGNCIAIGKDVNNTTGNTAQIGTSNSNKIVLGSGGQLSLVGAAKQFVQPNYTTAALPIGVTGATVYDTDTNELKVFDVTWNSIAGVTDHTLLTNIGTNTHAQIDTHISDLTRHYLKSEILVTDLGDTTITTPVLDEVLGYDGADWVNGSLTIVSLNELSNVLTTMNPTDGQVLTFDTTNGWQSETFAAGVTDHTLLTNIGTNTHAQIDTHIADTTLHFTKASISLNDLSNVFTAMNPADGHVLTYDTINGWQSEVNQHLTDHTALTNIGTNTHAQIDTHIAATTNPHATSIANLSDTVITGAVKGDLLAFNGTNWVDVSVGTDGDRLTADSAAAAGVSWQNEYNPISFNNQTGTTYTLTAPDAGSLVSMSNALSNNLTVPPNAQVAFAVGTEIIVEMGGAGVTSILPGSGVTINSTGSLISIAGQYSAVTLIKRSADVWLLIGDLV